MKKFSHLVALVAISVSLTTPLLAVAAVDQGTIDACNNEGKIYDAVTQGCIYPSSVTGTSGGINIAVIKPYSDSIINIVNDILVPVLLAIAFIVFLWGVFKYFIWHGESESEKADGRKFAMWGIIGFVIILSLWGVVNILMNALSLTTGSHPNPPRI